jgi:GxxExxY protein
MNHGIHGTHGNLLFEEETFRIRGAVFDVYRTLGAGFLEAIYQDSLEIEFEERGIPFSRPTLAVEYKGRVLKHGYAPDFLCFDQIIVELKATTALAREHRAQTFNYLRASGKRVGLLVNFGSSKNAEIERFAL